MNRKQVLLLSLSLFLLSTQANAQFGKLKGLVGKKDTSVAAKDTSAKSEKKGGGPSLWNKVVAKAAKVAGELGGSAFGLVSTTDDLTTVVPAISYTTNLHPAGVGVIAQTFFGGWEPGGNSLILSFTSKNGVSFNKIDGSVLVDGKPANYAAVGTYSSYSTNNTAPRRVEVTTKSGQKASFTVNPPAFSVKLLSINGQKDNISVDLTKDVVLELQHLPEGNNAPVMVWLTGNATGLKTFYEVGWFAASAKITIPAAMFRNMNGVKNNINFKDAYLQVSRNTMAKASNLSGAFSEVDYGSITTDGKFIQVSASPVFNKGLIAKGTDKYANGEVSYELEKQNAIFSKNFSSIKSVGVTSFAIQGTTSFYENKENRLTNIETTKTASFPQFSNAVWDGVLEKMYAQVTAILGKEFNTSVLPIERVTASAAYQSIAPFSKADQNTETSFTRGYKDTKLLLGFRPISEMGGIKSGEYKLMKETGANALLRFTINLDINFEGAKAFMTPKMVFEITGDVLGEGYNTQYLSGTITGKGVPYTGKITPEVLENTILRQADMLSTFQKALQDLKAKEKANGDYEIVWEAMYK